jgi:hypothetical protein
MRFTLILASLASLASAMALQPGDVPVEIAVRSDAYVSPSSTKSSKVTGSNGNIQHFYKRDAEDYIRKRNIEARQAKDLSNDPQSDTYAVQADAGGNLAPLYVFFG